MLESLQMCRRSDACMGDNMQSMLSPSLTQASKYAIQTRRHEIAYSSVALQGRTALQTASHKGHSGVVQALVSAGAKKVRSVVA